MRDPGLPNQVGEVVDLDPETCANCGAQLEAAPRMAPIQKETHRRLTILRDDPAGHMKARGIAKDLLRQWEAMWTFVKDDAAFPTNNEAESALRKAVLWRKGSFGINSEAGARFVERILTLA
jgi:transposase